MRLAGIYGVVVVLFSVVVVVVIVVEAVVSVVSVVAVDVWGDDVVLEPDTNLVTVRSTGCKYKVD